MSSSRSTRPKPYTRPSGTGNADGQWLHDRAPTGPEKGIPKGPRGNALNPNATPFHPAAVNTKLLVANLHYEVTPKDLISIFGQIGTLVREPLLMYDSSGRSEGKAIISFDTPAEATRAKKQFEGIPAKGQPMVISFYSPPSRPRRAASVPASSLLARVEKAPLADRISKDDIGVKEPKAPRAFNGGPVCHRPGRGAAAPAPKRSGGGNGGGGRGKKPKTAEDLDKELDAFMGDADVDAGPSGSNAAPATQSGDIEMA